MIGPKQKLILFRSKLIPYLFAFFVTAGVATPAYSQGNSNFGRDLVTEKIDGVDFTNDGKVDRAVTSYEYDERGNLLGELIEFDEDNDGTVDLSAVIYYNY